MSLIAPISHQLWIAAIEVFRLSCWLALLALIFVPLEKSFGLHPQKLLRRQFYNDIAYYFLNGLLPNLLLIPPTALIAWSLYFLVPAGLHGWVASLPFGAKLLGALVVGELGFYWGHRWTHEVPFLWRFHAVHHSAEQMDWLVNTRSHPLDIVFTRLCGFVPMFVLGFAQPMRNTLDIVPMLVLVIGTIWGFLIHSNVRWRLGWLGWLVSTPLFHHWHHTNDEFRDRNYAAMLPFFDRIFGTYHVPQRLWPTEYGVDAPLPESFRGQLVHPLVRTAPEEVTSLSAPLA